MVFLSLSTNPSRPVATTLRCLVFSLLLGLFSGAANAQIQSLPHAYAHNDYWHKRPLLDALDNGFTHVEADIYLRRSRLVVSHNPPLFRRKHTLEELYLRPLMARFEMAGANSPTSLDSVVLMIDIKSRGRRTLRALNKMIEKYRPVLTSCENGKICMRNLTLVITGHRALDLIGCEKARYVFVDADLKKMQDNRQDSTDLYMTASCKYSSLISWRGKGQIPLSQRYRLIELVDRAHACGAKVRLWGSPDKKRVWDFLINCGVDLINTDKLVALREYFTQTSKVVEAEDMELLEDAAVRSL